MEHADHPRHPARSIAVRLGLAFAVVCLGVLLHRLSDPFLSPPDDWVAFWSSSRLMVAGGDPYDADQLLALQRTAHWTKAHAYRVWEPPWALALLAPLAVLSYQQARFLWFVLHLALLLIAADRLWLYYGGDRRRRGHAWIIALTFAPAIICWKTGQLTVLVLAGIVAFLTLERRGRRAMAASAFIALASVKPHVVHLLCVAMAGWTVATRATRVAVAAVATAGLLVLTAWVVHPAIYDHFVRAMGGSPPMQPASTIGTVLRELGWAIAGRDAYQVVFVPPALAVAWLAVRWRSFPRPWRWETTAPLLVAVSLMTAPFAWIYDAVVLLVPAIAVLAPRLGRADGERIGAAGWGYAAINAGVFAQNVANVHPFLYVWVPIAMLVWYLAATRVRPGDARA